MPNAPASTRSPTGGSTGSGWAMGTDVGGTFTDLWLGVPDGRSLVCKAPTSSDVVGGVLDAVRIAAGLVGEPVETLCGRISRFGHGTTVGLNALLTGRAGKAALVATAGFGDVLEIGRMKRGTASLKGMELGDYWLRGRTPPLVPRQRVVEVIERVNVDGQIVVPLDEASLDEAIDRLAALDVDAVGICLLWSTENPEHELAVAARIAERLPHLFVTMSHEIAPSVGEYARASTAVANAALGPIAGGYLARLEDELRALGMMAPIMMTTNAGGVVPAGMINTNPVNGLLSGPASCVMAGLTIGQRLGCGNVLTMDVGGTSFDVGVIVDGKPLLRDDVTFGGADMKVPSIDIASIGAGGGSIARVVGSILAVGPESAGASPGPVCYGKGGTLPTTTDADLVLGVLDPERFSSGGIVLDAAAARAAIAAQIGAPLGLDAVAAARAIRVVFDTAMADLLRAVTIERGHDPRDFVLVAGGGSGPSHAWALCRELGLAGFVVPPSATAQSAFGAGTSDLRTTGARTCYTQLAFGVLPDAAVAAAIDAALEQTARTALAAMPDPGAARLTHTAAVRYAGQAHHLDVALSSPVTPASLASLMADFESDYEALFGKDAGYREAGLEVLSVRAIATCSAGVNAIGEGGDPFVLIGSRQVVFDDPARPEETAIWACRNPAPDQRLEGPCLIELPGCVVVVPPSAKARTDTFGLIHVEILP